MSAIRLRHELRKSLPATLGAIEGFIGEFRQNFGEQVPRGDAFGIELLLREALTNAVVHGCCQDPSRRAGCIVRMGTDRMTIAVSDPGEGFDWRAAGAKTTDDAGTSGRGMEILRVHSSRVRFNARGNAVVIWRRIGGGEHGDG